MDEIGDEQAETDRGRRRSERDDERDHEGVQPVRTAQHGGIIAEPDEVDGIVRHRDVDLHEGQIDRVEKGRQGEEREQQEPRQGDDPGLFNSVILSW